MLRLDSSLRRIGALALATAGLVVSAALPSGATTGSEASQKVAEAKLKGATAKYRFIPLALADGFVATDECAELPGVGGMGYHYVNPERLADGVIDPNRPDILLYAEDGNGRLRLAAVEWIAVDPDQDLSTDAGRPTLFGQEFDGPMPGHVAGMPIHFDLHAWIWMDNPAGTFESWNPAVTCG